MLLLMKFGIGTLKGVYTITFFSPFFSLFFLGYMATYGGVTHTIKQDEWVLNPFCPFFMLSPLTQC